MGRRHQGPLRQPEPHEDAPDGGDTQIIGMECSYPLAGKLTIPNPDTKKIEEIDVLIDTGAEISFIGNVLIECLHLPVIEVRPKVSNADVDFKRSLKVSILTHSENDLVKPSILLISDQPSGESEKET
ncbi:hypothetical protein RB195_022039 [Necator americanus]|uniref:Peptidase A2 domain-containing protein n=1 Tax=Necator americanus TaxID=51031 RepID=A0ABR1EDT4_NECAM